MTAVKLSAGAICLSLVLSASAFGSPMRPQAEDRQASGDTAPSAASHPPAPSLISNGDNIIFSSDKPRRESMPVFAHGRSAGGGGGISEGIKLETLLWGGGGAIIGSLAGPVGAIVGGSIGSLVGLTIGIIMPRRQNSPKFRG